MPCSDRGPEAGGAVRPSFRMIGKRSAGRDGAFFGPRELVERRRRPHWTPRRENVAFRAREGRASTRSARRRRPSKPPRRPALAGGAGTFVAVGHSVATSGVTGVGGVVFIPRGGQRFVRPRGVGEALRKGGGLRCEAATTRRRRRRPLAAGMLFFFRIRLKQLRASDAKSIKSSGDPSVYAWGLGNHH